MDEKEENKTEYEKEKNEKEFRVSIPKVRQKKQEGVVVLVAKNYIVVNVGDGLNQRFAYSGNKYKVGDTYKF